MTGDSLSRLYSIFFGAMIPPATAAAFVTRRRGVFGEASLAGALERIATGVAPRTMRTADHLLELDILEDFHTKTFLEMKTEHFVAAHHAPHV